MFTRTTPTTRTATAAILAAVGVLCAVIAAHTDPGNFTFAAVGLGGHTPAAATSAGPANGSTGWAASGEGIAIEGGDPLPAPDAVDPSLATDQERLNAYAVTATVSNNGTKFGASRWNREGFTYRLALPAHYPAAVADEVRTAYRWASEVTGVPATEVTSGTADIIVDGWANNGGLTSFNAVGGHMGKVSVHIGCCRRRAVWEEVVHSMGLYADTGPRGSIVADYDLRPYAQDVPSAADATVLRALYSDSVAAGAGPDQVQAAIVTAAGNGTP